MVPTTGTPAIARSKVGPLAPGQCWSVVRKREVVLRLLRGESVELLCRDLGVPIVKLEQWHQTADAALDGALKEREAKAASTELAAAMHRIGEVSMENEWLRAKMDRPGPLARRTSRVRRRRRTIEASTPLAVPRPTPTAFPPVSERGTRPTAKSDLPCRRNAESSTKTGARSAPTGRPPFDQTGHQIGSLQPSSGGGLARRSFLQGPTGTPPGSLDGGWSDLETPKIGLLECGFDEPSGAPWCKGCSMGQEVTARTRYRRLPRKRLFPGAVVGPLPAPVTRDGARASGEAVLTPRISARMTLPARERA